MPLSSSFGSLRSHSDREARSSGFDGSARLPSSIRTICQYQPDSGSSNSGSPSAGCALSSASSGGATSAISVRR